MMKEVIVDLRVDNASHLRMFLLTVTRWTVLRWSVARLSVIRLCFVCCDRFVTLI